MVTYADTPSAPKAQIKPKTAQNLSLASFLLKTPLIVRFLPFYAFVHLDIGINQLFSAPNRGELWFVMELRQPGAKQGGCSGSAALVYF